MKLALASNLPALRRNVLAGSVAAFVLAESLLGAEVTWNGVPQTLTSANGGDDVTLESSTVITLGTAGSPDITFFENTIVNNSLRLPGVTTLTINSADATRRTLVSAGTTLAAVNGQSLVIAGTADFRMGFLGDGGFENVQLVKNGTGELILDGIFNDLNGVLLRIVSGTVSVEGGGGAASPISTLNTAIVIESATAKLRLGTPNGSATTFNNSLLVIDSGTLEHTAASNDTLTGSVTIDSAKTLTTNVIDGSLTLGGGIIGGSLSKTGAGTLVLSGTNTYTGTTAAGVGGGTLQFAREASLYNNTPTSWTKANITANSGATLAFNVGGGGEFTASDVTTLLGNLTAAINNNGLRAGSRIAFDTTNAAGGTFTIANVIADSTGTGSGSLGVTKLGANNLTLTAASTYTGGTTVNNGTLTLNGVNNGTGVIRGVVTINPAASVILASPNALGYNAGVAVTAVNINGGLFDDTASLDQGFNQTYNLTGGTMRSNGGVSNALAAQYYAFGTGTAVNTFASATTSLIAGRINLRNDNLHTDVPFTVADGTASTDLLVSAAITENSPAVGITKAGPGLMLVTGASSYTGGTVVSAGTLSLTGSLGNTAITVSPGATFAARPGSAMGYAGTSITAGTSGLTLSGGAASAASFNMVDNAIGTFRLGTGGLVTQAGAFVPTLTFEIGSTLGSMDRLDLATMGGNAVIAPGTKVDFASLAGATSLVTGNYTFLTTAANGLGPSVFALANSTITVGGITYNFSLASSTTAAEILTITAVPSGNNSQLLITSSPDSTSVVTGASAKTITFGRVMQNSIQTTTVQTIGKTGTDAATYAVTPAGAVTTTIGGANFAAGSQSTSGTITLNTTATGSQTGTVTIANTIGTSLSAGLGSADANDVFTLTGTVLRQRGTDAASAFSATSVSLGRIMLGSTGSGTTTLATAGGNDSNYTRVAVAGSTTPFDGSAGTGTSQTRSVSGTVSAASGTLASLAVTTAESAGVNDSVAYNSILVAYTATPLLDRVVTADTVGFGLVHIGGTASAPTTLRTTGNNNSRTAIRVGNGSGGGFSLTGGTNPIFTDASVTDGRTLGGTLGAAGAFANVTALTLTPGTEAGVAGTQAPVDVVVRYSADVFSGTAVWNGPNPGSWGTSASANWTDTMTASIHAAPGTFGATFAGTDSATFNAAGNGTVNLDGATPSLAAVIFSSGSHTLAKGSGAGVLTLKRDAGPAVITDSAGSQSITAPVVLSSNVTVTVTQAADLLTWSGGLDGAGKTLTKEGAGTLTLSGIQHYATLIANAGVTNLNSALGTGTSTLQANAKVNLNASQTLAALVIGSGVEVTFGDGLAFVAPPEKFAAAVPEPGSFVLLLAGGLGVLGHRRRR